MKFKYNFFKNKLWKLKDEYAYEVSENNHFRTPQGVYGSDTWSLGNQEEITFTFTHWNLKVYYQTGIVAYQKTLDFPPNGEIIFEFSEQDRINSS